MNPENEAESQREHLPDELAASQTRSTEQLAASQQPHAVSAKLVPPRQADELYVHLRDEATLLEEAAEGTWAALERTRAESALRESEAKYRTLFESIDQGFYIAECFQDDTGRVIDFRHLEVNAAVARMTGLGDVTGKLVSEVVPDLEPHWLEPFDRVVRTGESMRFENYNEATRRWYEAYYVRIGGPGSRRVGVTVSDTTERNLAEAAMRMREEQQAFLLKLSDDFRSNPGEVAVGRACVDALAAHMGVERCHITELSEELGRGIVGPEYYEPGLAPIAGVHRYADYPDSMRNLQNGDPFVSSDVDNDARLSETDKVSLRHIGLQSIIVAPLYEGLGNSIWALAVGSVKPRAWTDEDRRLVQNVGERTWAAIERDRTHRLALEEAERVIATRTSERDSLRRQLAQAEEAERQRLSRELHDQLGQQLTAFRLGLADARRLVASGDGGGRPADTRLLARIGQLEALADTMTRGARNIALELRPLELDDAGLASALETYAHEWARRYGVAVEVAVIPSVEEQSLQAAVPGDIASALFRIAQEGLTNVAKHARATHVSLVIDRRDGDVRLIIEDDGDGFDLEEARARARHDRRLGLDGMEERAALFGGKVVIESVAQSGTTVIVRLPVSE